MKRESKICSKGEKGEQISRNKAPVLLNFFKKAFITQLMSLLKIADVIDVIMRHCLHVITIIPKY
jgi:hypothetical protein